MSKAEKEAAVYGQLGTTLWETAMLIATMPLLLKVSSSVFQSSSYWAEIVLVAIPLLVAHTVGADAFPAGALFIPLCCLILALLFDSPGPPDQRLSPKTSKENYAVTVLRGTTVLSTLIAILAVDFPAVFPRRYVKTEWYGTGLMDVGVGAYVFTGAIVRGKNNDRTSAKTTLRTTLMNSLPVILLGLIRATVNKMVDYQEHVSEYGMHWNFFITLAFVRLFGDALATMAAQSKESKFFLGCFLIVLHQALLSSTILGTYVMFDSDSRERQLQGSIFWQNKEGLISLTGYVALDLITRGIAEKILSMPTRELLYLDAFLWTALNFNIAITQNVSRRSANMSFVLWILSIGVMIVYLSSALELGNDRKSQFMQILSRHQLAMFLIANILTGLINMTFDTLNASVTKSLIILAGYVSLISVVGYALENRKSIIHSLQHSKRSLLKQTDDV